MEANIQIRSNKIRSLIKEYHLSNSWLINEFARRDLIVSPTELGEMLRGNRKGAKAIRVIELAEIVLDKYKKLYYEN